MPRAPKRSLLDYLDSLHESLRSVVPDAVTTGESKAVHQARVTTRRLRAALDVIDPITTGGAKKQLAKALRKLRKNLGQTRDLDVMIAHLDEFKSPRLASGTLWTKGQLIERARQSKLATREKLNPDKVISRLAAWQDLRQQCVDAGEDALHRVLVESLHLQLERFIEQANRQSGRPVAAPDPSAVDPHALRITGKLLRYTLELAIASGHKIPARVMRAFKRMQDSLGFWHDFIVMADELLGSAVGLSDINLSISIVELARESLRRSQRQLLKFDRLWTLRGEELAATIRAAFPLTEVPDPLNQMQTGRGPADLAAPEAAPALILPTAS